VRAGKPSLDQRIDHVDAEEEPGDADEVHGIRLDEWIADTGAGDHAPQSAEDELDEREGRDGARERRQRHATDLADKDRAELGRRHDDGRSERLFGMHHVAHPQE